MYSLNVISIFGFAFLDLVGGVFCFIPIFSQGLIRHGVCTVKEGRSGKSLRAVVVLVMVHHRSITASEQAAWAACVLEGVKWGPSSS